MKTRPIAHHAVTLSASDVFTRWITSLRAHLLRPRASDYPLTHEVLADLGLSEADLMAIRSGRFEEDGTRRRR